MIEKLDSKAIYENPWMKVREDNVRFPNGHEGIYGVVEKPDFSLIIPYENNGFYIVKQYRYPVGESFWEFPQGTYEDGNADASLQALNELKEETGLIPESMEEIGYAYQAYGYCNQGYHIFLASNFSRGEAKPEVTESDMVSKWVSEEEFCRMIDDGEIRDASTLASYCRYLRWKVKDKVPGD